MEKYKQLIARARELADEEDEELLDVLWKVIFYPPKVAVLPYQRHQLDEAAKFSVTVTDRYGEESEISVNGYSWGKGQHKILLTHGWASKAADFSEIIIALRQLPDVTIIAFDAPGNGSSDGALSNLILYIDAVKAVIQQQGMPDTLIGHSMGATANVAALQQMNVFQPLQLISLTPLIRLKEIFIASMDAAHVSAEIKKHMLRKIEACFNMPVTGLDMDQDYHLDKQAKHWVAYDKEDTVSSYYYLNEFLEKHPSVLSQSYSKVGHTGILHDPGLITDVLKRVHMQIIQNQRDVTVS